MDWLDERARTKRAASLEASPPSWWARTVGAWLPWSRQDDDVTSLPPASASRRGSGRQRNSEWRRLRGGVTNAAAAGGTASGTAPPSRRLLMSIDTRLAWEREWTRERRAEYATIYGSYAAGACAAIDHSADYGAGAALWNGAGPCAYYLFVREPIARLISEYNYCHAGNFTDQTCTGRRGARHARSLPGLAAWAEERGNVLLEHLLPLAAHDWRNGVVHGAAGDAGSVAGGAADDRVRIDVPWRARDTATRVNPIETRRARQGPATRADLYVALSELRRRFAVIGLTERYDESLQMFAWALTGETLPPKVYKTARSGGGRRDKPGAKPVAGAPGPRPGALASLADLTDAEHARVHAAVALDLEL